MRTVSVPEGEQKQPRPQTRVFGVIRWPVVHIGLLTFSMALCLFYCWLSCFPLPCLVTVPPRSFLYRETFKNHFPLSLVREKWLF